MPHPTSRRRHLRSLAAAGLVFVVLGLGQAVFSDADAAGYGMATGGAVVVAIAIAIVLRNHTERPH